MGFDYRVQGSRGDVGAIRPDDGSGLGVYPHVAEEGRGIEERFEHGAPEKRLEVDDPNGPVRERQLNHVPPEQLHVGHIDERRDLVAHRSLVPSQLLPQRTGELMVQSSIEGLESNVAMLAEKLPDLPELRTWQLPSQDFSTVQIQGGIETTIAGLTQTTRRSTCPSRPAKSAGSLV